MPRKTSVRTNGNVKNSTTRLVSPADLGEQLKPFIFLDRFDLDFNKRQSAPLYPHSGIGIITVFTSGDVAYDDSNGRHGVLEAGGAQWDCTGKGMWLGQELSAGKSERAQGFQLWVALPPELENSKATSQFIEQSKTQSAGPAKVILGQYHQAKSVVSAPLDMNFLLVELQPGESWTYELPKTHNVLWLSLASGSLEGDINVSNGELVAFEQSNQPVTLTAGNESAVFVLGSATKHPYHLHFGRHSVHTSQNALFKAEKHIAFLKDAMNVPLYRPAQPISVPVFHGYS